MTHNYEDAERRQHSEEHSLLIRLLDGQNELKKDMANQHEVIEVAISDKLEKHCADKHKSYEPDHDEQHKRGGAYMRRIDSMWDNAFKAIGIFLLISLGYGILVVMKAKGLPI